MYSTYLFDLDGTLYDRDNLVRSIAISQFEKFGAELRQISEQEYVSKIERLDNHGHLLKEVLYEKLAFELSLDTKLKDRLLKHFWETYDNYLVLDPDIRRTLRGLKEAGVKLGIITNGGTARQQMKIQMLGLHDYFDVILISEQEGIKKPNPEIFRRALERCCVSHQTSVFIGDNPIADIDGAKAAGLDAIWKSVPYWDMTRPDVKSINQLSELLIDFE